jgi:hypothetical protein
MEGMSLDRLNKNELMSKEFARQEAATHVEDDDFSRLLNF